MNMLILTPELEMELASINMGGDPERQLTPVELSDGNYGLNADLLEDCEPGETWEYYSDFLEELPIEVVSINAIEEPQLT